LPAQDLHEVRSDELIAGQKATITGLLQTSHDGTSRVQQAIEALMKRCTKFREAVTDVSADTVSPDLRNLLSPQKLDAPRHRRYDLISVL
jgi:hypothetical protein